MELIKPEDVEYIFNNPDGSTSTVGIRVIKFVDVPDRLTGRPVSTKKIIVEKKELPTREANILASAVKKIRSQIDKFERDNGPIKQTKLEERRFNGQNQRK